MAYVGEGGDCIAFDRDASQTAGSERSRIEIETIRPHIERLHRRMAMDDELFEPVFAVKKFVANPEQIFFPLPADRNSGA
jgi:hypothetical protein